MKSFTSILITAFSACVVLAPALSHAATPAPSSVTVHYSDLNLSSEAGNAALYARLEAAAREVCGTSDIRDLGQLASVQACQKNAIAHAVHEVHSTQLAAVLARRAGQG